MRSYYPSGSAWKRALGSLRHEHPRTFAMKLIAELGYRRTALLERPLDEPIPDGPKVDGVEFAQIGADRLDEYLAYRTGSERDAVAALFADGAQCHVLRRHGEIVSSCWATEHPRPSNYIRMAVPMEPGDVYMTDAWTHADHRGHAYAHILCLHQLRVFRDRGCRRAIRLTIPENVSALRAHAKSGFRPVAIVGSVRVGPWQRSFRRPWRSGPL